ncbi:hypothetical protein BC831DRAFT_443880 [Entophlyctis helioformis]|nr:hypothetical protein BC831DRAFT_443880 [Entophlyctis helioformis]
MARKPVPLASPSDDLFFANIRVDFSLYPHFLRIVGKQIEMRNKSVIVAMHPDSIQKWADKVQPSNPKSAEHASRSSLALVNSFHKQKRRKLAAAEKKIAPRVLAAKIQPRLAGSCTDILRSSEASMPAAAPAAENHSHFRSPTPSPPRKSERRQSTQVSRLQSTNELQLQLQSNHDQLRLHQRDESHPSQPSRHFPSTSQEATTTARYNVAEQEQASLLDFAAVMQHQQTNQRPQPCGMPPIEPSVRSTFDALCFKPGKDLSSYSLQYASSQPALQRYQHRSHGESSGAATRSPSVLQQGPLLAPLRRRLARNASPLSLQSQPPLLPHAVTLALHQTLSSAPLVSQQTQPDKIQRQQPQQTLPDPRPSSQPSRIQTQPRLSSPSGFHSQDQPPAMSRRTSLNVSHLSAEVSPQTASQHHSGRALATQMQSQSLQQYQSRRLPHALLSHPFQSQERAHQHEYSAWQQARFISGTTSDDIQRVAVLLHPRVHQLAHYQQLSQQQRQEQQQYVHVQLPTSYPHF